MVDYCALSENGDGVAHRASAIVGGLLPHRVSRMPRGVAQGFRERLEHALPGRRRVEHDKAVVGAMHDEEYRVPQP